MGDRPLCGTDLGVAAMTMIGNVSSFVPIVDERDEGTGGHAGIMGGAFRHRIDDTRPTRRLENTRRAQRTLLQSADHDRRAPARARTGIGAKARVQDAATVSRVSATPSTARAVRPAPGPSVGAGRGGRAPGRMGSGRPG